ncbi:hypothetical protein [Streptomyces sp. NPDC086023]|uniref:hypothetical protein n=1 Tax=Streptomyces sp. NPDC086023 TaxID=3365746 RepID=UPI0037D2C85A
MPTGSPASFLAAATALAAVERELRDAHDAAGTTTAEPSQALAALMLLREVREQLAGWESGLIETARAAGASWADLAGPLGVASRQAAERRYLRLRPGAEGATGEERVQATRDRRAAQRSVNAWARDHAADLRQIAGQVSAVTGLDGPGHDSVDQVRRALGGPDPATLLGPLAAAAPHLRPHHRGLADRIDTLIRQTDRLRTDSNEQRRTR